MPTPLPTPLPDNPIPLPTGGLRSLLRSFGGVDAYGNPPEPRTGSITIVTDAAVGNIYLKSGRVYSIGYTGFTPPLARRLLTSAHITPVEFDVLAASDTPDDEETIRRLTAVTPDDLENINRQMLLSSLTHLYTWKPAQWKWQPDATTTRNTISALEPGLLVTATDERQGQWGALSRNFPQVVEPDAVPAPGPDYPDEFEPGTHPETVAVLSYVDGSTPNRIIAGTVGLTRFELAGRLAAAAADGRIVYPKQPRRRGKRPSAQQPTPDVSAKLAELLQERETLNERLAAVNAAIEALRG